MGGEGASGARMAGLGDLTGAPHYCTRCCRVFYCKQGPQLDRASEGKAALSLRRGTRVPCPQIPQRGTTGDP